MNTLKEVGQAAAAVTMLTAAIVGIAAGIGAFLFGIVAPYASPAISKLSIPSF